MRSLFLLISFFVLYCNTSYSQTPFPEFTALKSGKMKLEEFKKIDSLELNTRSISVIRYTAYFVCGKPKPAVPDSICKNVFTITVEGNSLKAPGFIKILNQFSPPFILVFDNIKVLDP